MRHKITIPVKVERKTLFGRVKEVTEYHTMYVNASTYKKLKQNKPFTVEEMMFYDMMEDD